MKIIAAVLALIVSGAAFAAPETAGTGDQRATTARQAAIDARYRLLERVDVTAEKQLAPKAQREPVSDEVADILAEAEALEDAE